MTGLSRQERRLLEPIEQQSMLDRVLDWAALNTGTGNLGGLAMMAGRLADAFSVLPGKLALRDPDPVEAVGADGRIASRAHGRHLVLRVRPGAARRVLLTGHMDTVFAPDHFFQQCDWLDAATLRGPGTSDMKGGIALMLSALEAFEKTGPRLGYDVLINSDEETGSSSSAGAIRELAAGKIAALTYEPALPGGAMAKARPGSGNFAAVVKGCAAHAGRNPEDGRNALVAAADLALRLARSRRDALGINPARIDGGGPDNLVPDLAVLRFNMRPCREEDAADAASLVDRTIMEVAREHDVQIHLHGAFGRPPKRVGEATERLFAMVSRASADLGEPLTWQDTGGVCDGNNIAACGLPVIDTMGARGGNIHSPGEFLLVDSLSERARLSALVLHRLDRGEILP
ncbi:MAG TPA: hydrolase [Novosphingobium sp.]